MLADALRVTDGDRRCQVVVYGVGGTEDCDCGASLGATVICKSCGPREVFVCSDCFEELMRVIDLSGWVCCTKQGPSHEVVALMKVRPVPVVKY